jgi:signal transduction histidine kinase
MNNFSFLRWHVDCVCSENSKAAKYASQRETVTSANFSGTELILKLPIKNALAPWRNGAMSAMPEQAPSIRQDRDMIVALQWLVAIAISYLVLAVQDWALTTPTPALLIIVCLLSGVGLNRIPEEVFNKNYIRPGLLILDSFLIVSAMILRDQTPWDLLLLFFFCVFIAAIGDNLIQVGVASLLLALVFLLFLSPQAKDALAINPDLLVRIPFMFGISLFYGYMSTQARQEKKRVEQMEQAMRMKRQIIAALAHDIKTPLNVILGHAELLAEDDVGNNKAPIERGSSLQCIRDNIDRIVQLVTDFLAVSKLETLGIGTAKTLIDINAIAEDVVLQQMVMAREKNIALTLKLDDELKPVMGDSSEIQRALWNLVANAIKFTPPTGSVTVSSRMMQNSVCVEVADTGPGIPKNQMASLFSEFKRLEASRNTEGTGLGLFIVKTIVEAHNGHVTVESREGEGAKFSMLLPVSKEPIPIRAPVKKKSVGEQAA